MIYAVLELHGMSTERPVTIRKVWIVKPVRDQSISKLGGPEHRGGGSLCFQPSQ